MKQVKYSCELIDFHSHILPGADHGSASSEMTEKQLNLIRSANVATVIATPHFYPNRHSLGKFLSRRAESINRMESKCNTDGVKIMCGAEVLVCESIDKMAGLESLCIEKTSLILLEMPTTFWNDGYYATVKNIKNGSGLKPILAHIDRYPYDDIVKLLNMGIPGQINACALLSAKGRKKYLPMIENGTVVALGSDLHGCSKKDYRIFLKACGVLAKNGLLTLLMENTKRLIKDAEKAD